MAKKFHGQIDLSAAADLVRAGYGKQKEIGGKMHTLIYVDVWERADDKKNQYADHDVTLSLTKEQRENFPQGLYRNVGNLKAEAQQAQPAPQAAPRPQVASSSGNSADNLPF